MNSLTVFENIEFGKLNALIINNEPWFIGKEVAGILGYKDTKSAVRDLIDEDDKLHLTYNELLNIFRGGEFPPLKINNNGMIVINESGFYSLVLGSKLETAKKFKKWVTSEVLPSIRKTGSYLPKSYQIEDPIARARAWADEQEAIRNKELQHLLELKRLEEEKEKLAISNCRQSCKIKNLRALLTIYEHKKNNDFVDEDDYPDYMTTTTRKSIKKVWWYWPLALKALTLYYGYELHRISEVRYGNQLIYPVDIFELYEEITDKYWDEIKSNELNYKGDEDWKYKSEDLAKFIIDKVKAEGREAEFMKY